MPSLPDSRWTHGTFTAFRLHCVPEVDPPNLTQKSPRAATYPYPLGFIHIYLDDRDATGQLPSTHVFFALMAFAGSIIKLFHGQSASFSSTTEPFDYHIHANRDDRTVTLTYGWEARDESFIRGAVIPMLPYFMAVIHACEEWLGWVETHFDDEITDDRRGKEYRWLYAYLAIARLCAARLQAEIGRESRLAQAQGNGRSLRHPDPSSESPAVEEAHELRALKARLAAAQAEGATVTLDIQALSFPVGDQQSTAVDLHYSVDGDPFTHTFLDQPERLLAFLGVADAPADVLLTMLRQLIEPGVAGSEEWEEASLFAEINASGQGMTYGRYTTVGGESLPFDTDFAAYALFDVIRNRYSGHIWQRARFSVNPFWQMEFDEGDG